LTAISYIKNNTITLTGANLTSPALNFTSDGDIYTRSVIKGAYNVSYTYKADSTTTTTLSSVNTAIAAIATTWLPLIVTVAVLAIILGLVLSSFGMGVGRNKR
jgi:hypothetical protein